MNFEITSNNQKEKIEYLEQIKNNTSEKTEVLIELINNKTLPLVNGKVRLLEIGTGDGSAMNVLRKGCVNQDLEIIGMDKFPMIAKIFQEKTGEYCVVGDLLNIPLNSNSMSAVNASAIFHEISSYGSLEESGTKLIIGDSAIQKSFAEINRVLVPGGSFVYRDVNCPKNPEEIKNINYYKKSWKLFLEWFLPDFLGKFRRIFPDAKSDVMCSENSGNLQVTASARIHRELQRHYIMLRDYFRTQMKEQIGLEVIEEKWSNVDSGLKLHHVKVGGILAAILKEENVFADENAEIVLGSEIYDKVFDVLIERSFANGILMEKMEEWKKREGFEIYTYKNFEGMIDAALNSIERDSAESYVLFPQKDEDMKIAPRDYYENYLRTVIDKPERDGKQLIHFVKQTPSEALQSLFSMHDKTNFKNKISFEVYMKIIKKLQNMK